MPGQVPPASVLPPDHQLGMQVPKGGSMCANCKFLAGPDQCGNQGFITWNGSPQLPAPADEYCCDLYEPGQAPQMAGQGPDQAGPQGEQERVVAALRGPQA